MYSHVQKHWKYRKDFWNISNKQQIENKTNQGLNGSKKRSRLKHG